MPVEAAVLNGVVFEAEGCVVKGDEAFGADVFIATLAESAKATGIGLHDEFGAGFTRHRFHHGLGQECLHIGEVQVGLCAEVKARIVEIFESKGAAQVATIEVEGNIAQVETSACSISVSAGEVYLFQADFGFAVFDVSILKAKIHTHIRILGGCPVAFQFKATVHFAGASVGLCVFVVARWQ